MCFSVPRHRPPGLPAFLAPLERQSWVTYIEPPPAEASAPVDVVKYLARYLTGGPISDYRITRHDGQHVCFAARTGTTHGGSDETEEVSLPASEFVRRWCLHILPKGFTKSRRFGGWSNYHRPRYVKECRRLMDVDEGALSETDSPNDSVEDGQNAGPVGPKCPQCNSVLERLERVFRTSWRDVFAGESCPAWYRTRDRAG